MCNFSKGVYNEAGGFHHTSLIDRSLIDHHVPFLPLEKRHVRRCVARELARRGLTYNEQVVDKTLSMLPFWPQDVQVREALHASLGSIHLVITQKIALF